MNETAKKAVDLLLKKGRTIAVAESCTGGLIAKLITDIPGSSEVFHLGAVTYSNDIKAKILGVDKKTLETYGAVSEQTAVEMAENVLNCQHPLDHRKSKRVPEKHLFLLY